MGDIFDSDTEVTCRAGGTYDAKITDRWNALHGTPLGSYGLAVAVRALARRMPHPDPLSVSAYFLRPVEGGPAVAHTEVARTGNRMATGQVSLSQDGEEKLRAIATFTDLHRVDGDTSMFGGPPQLPPPDECVDPLDGVAMPGMSLLDRVEYRTTEVPGWLRGEPGGTPARDLWMRLRDGREPDPLALVLLWDAMSPMVLEIGRSPSTTLEATVHIRRRPARGWLACRVGTRYVTGGLCEEDMDIWDSAGRLVAQSRQLTLLHRPAPS
ncbi:thioesterase family protein [Actinomadura sp. 3N407]|uniref:thioesterase family protein n=1 Tax=Actinomadura sp. 3N407 TaxID=3457423 RepID=UPI003FCC910F